MASSSRVGDKKGRATINKWPGLILVLASCILFVMMICSSVPSVQSFAINIWKHRYPFYGGYGHGGIGGIGGGYGGGIGLGGFGGYGRR